MLTVLVLASLLSSQQSDVIGSRKLVWKEEFEGTGAVDTTKWNFDTGPVYNNEKEKYVDDLKHTHISNGSLVITADNDDGRILSGRLTSKQSWKYGYFEVRAQFPTGKGTWPAIWFLGNSLRKSGAENVGWPKCGEIDLMENVGFDPDSIHFTVHTAEANGSGHTYKGDQVRVPGAWKGYHVYGLDWQPDHMDFYLDGKKSFTYTKDAEHPALWPFDAPQYMILNLAIGGDWGGQQGVDPNIFPAKFLVDYVRVYQ